MPRTTLRRRRADAYRVQLPPAATATDVTGAHQVAWDAAAGQVVYQRSIGQWLYREGGNPQEANDIVDPGKRRDEIAAVPLAALPLADPAGGTRVLEYHRTPTGQPPFGFGLPTWEPGATVLAMAVHPVLGDLAVYWYRDDEVPLQGQSVLHLDRFSAAGGKTGGQVIPLDYGFVPDSTRAPIACAWDAGGLWAIEPQPWPASPDDVIDFALPSRIVRRSGPSLDQSHSARNLEEGAAVGWPGGDSICPDPLGIAGCWAIITRRWLEGTGPFPTFDAPNVYDVTYLLPLAADLTGAEQLLTFGHGAAAPWAMDEIASRGRSTVFDSASVGVPTFVSIGNDPEEWPEGGSASIWRWRHEGGDGIRESAAAFSGAGGLFGRSLWRIAPGQYLAHKERSAPVSLISLEVLP